MVELLLCTSNIEGKVSMPDDILRWINVYMYVCRW